MGTTYSYKCKKCDHQVESSGKLDQGMETVVEPYKCVSCNDIVDVEVGIFGRKILKEELTEEMKIIYYRCPDCNGEQLTEWDVLTHPCPKCGEKMTNLGVYINWD